jgi:nucleoside 2-deoxyribosyltransferase
MKIFLSFRYTGETEGGLREFFTPVVESLRKQGHEVHFGLDDIKAGEGQGQTVGQMILAGLEKLSEYDMLFCAVRNPERSEGMLMEVGYALAKNIPIILAVKKGTNTYIAEVAEKVVEFEDQIDLEEVVNSPLMHELHE